MDKESLNKVLTMALKTEASDIHFKVGSPILFRIHGTLLPTKSSPLSPTDVEEIALILIPKQKDKERLEELHEYDCSYAIEDVGRFRVNIFRQKDSFAAILRSIPLRIPSFEELKLPPVLADIAMEERGLILVTGVTGSGKSTTLAAMIDYINARKRVHIITIEDPMEFLHKDKKASVCQREIGPDTENFNVALRAALRQDPDVILVGEMRDTETIDIALKASETGHLVFSTVHTTDAVKSVGRLISVFPSDAQNLVRIRLAENLRATISQRLLITKDGKGRVVAAEIMKVTRTIEDCIKESEKTPLIKDYIQKGRSQYSMQTFDQHLIDLYKSGQITFETAKAAATSPADFERAIMLDEAGTDD
jgi:twitching motility protein PilT